MSEFEVTREEDEAFNALGKQVAGNHYKDLPIQPVQYIHATMRGMHEFLRALQAVIDNGKVAASIAERRFERG